MHWTGCSCRARTACSGPTRLDSSSTLPDPMVEVLLYGRTMLRNTNNGMRLLGSTTRTAVEDHSRLTGLVTFLAAVLGCCHGPEGYHGPEYCINLIWQAFTQQRLVCLLSPFLQRRK